MNRDQVSRRVRRRLRQPGDLAPPIDKGFNRLAWLLPVSDRRLGRVGAIVIARRWSRRSSREPSAGRAADDAPLRTELDDELRDLD